MRKKYVIDRSSAVVGKGEDGWDFPTVNNISGGNQSKGGVTVLAEESERHQSFVDVECISSMLLVSTICNT